MKEQKSLYEMYLQRDRFCQADCKNLFKKLKGVPGFSHRENRRFYFHCTEQDWKIMQESINLLNSKLENKFTIKQS